MQFAHVNGVTLHYQLIGGPANKPVIVFSNSLGTDFRIWRDVIVRLAGDFAIVTYDKRGHGLSDVGASPYSIDDHVGDLAALHLGFQLRLDTRGLGLSAARSLREKRRQQPRLQEDHGEGGDDEVPMLLPDRFLVEEDNCARRKVSFGQSPAFHFSRVKPESPVLIAGHCNGAPRCERGAPRLGATYSSGLHGHDEVIDGA